MSEVIYGMVKQRVFSDSRGTFWKPLFLATHRNFRAAYQKINSAIHRFSSFCSLCSWYIGRNVSVRGRYAI